MVNVPEHNCNSEKINKQYNEAISLVKGNDVPDVDMNGLWINRANASCSRALDHLDANALECPNMSKIQTIFETYIPVSYSRKYAKSISKWKLIDEHNDYMMRYVNNLLTDKDLVNMYHYLQSYTMRNVYPEEYKRIRVRILQANLLPKLEDYYSLFNKSDFYDDLPGNYQLGIIL